MRVLPYLAVILIGVMTSCNIINPKEEIPTYIYIDSFHVQSVATSVHGSTSNKITDAWVYMNNDIVGVYELPAKIPLIIKDPNTALTISAGIWDNGISGLRVRYPFYRLSEHTLSPSPGNVIPLTPITTYNTNAKFHLIEDFEQGNSFVKFLGDTNLFRTTDPTYVFEGTNSGLVIMTNTKRGTQMITAEKLKLPGDMQSYMEINYRGNVDFTIKAQVTKSGQPVVTGDILSVKERSSWNKIYVNLTPYGTAYPGSDFNFILTVGLPEGKTDGYLAIDNFKVVSF